MKEIEEGIESLLKLVHALREENASLITTIESQAAEIADWKEKEFRACSKHHEFIDELDSKDNLIESQKEEMLECIRRDQAERHELFLHIESLKAITELAVTCLQRIDSIRESYPASFQHHHVDAAFIKAERLTTDALEEIARIQNAQT